MNKTLLACALAAATTLAAGGAFAATIIPVNMNDPGVGLNDPTPATPVGGNPGTTVGEQRRIAYQFAADLWGAVLESDVEIRVRAQFTPLSCTATSGVLGSAGAMTVHANFPNAAATEIWYGAALANSLAGSDLGTTTDDINSNFNANLGTPGCLEGSGWYYGLDGSTPAGKINFLDVVMHEIGHGLNFQGLYTLSPGAPFNGRHDIYGTFVHDTVSGLDWVDMTNAQRQAAVTGGGLVWTGAAVTDEVPIALAPVTTLNGGGTISGQFVYGQAQFGAPATPANFSGELVLVNDGSANPTFGCVASPAGAYAGRIAVVDRGNCAFEIKVKFAEDAGATAVIVANNTTGVITMAEDPSVAATVPALSVSQADGAILKAGIPGATLALEYVPDTFAGADAEGRALMYAPAVLASGSSFSHFDTSLSPNALMEPNNTSDTDASLRLDLTPALFQDLGWTLNPGNASTNGGSCDTGIPAVEIGGLVGGANLQAADAMCRDVHGSGSAGYRSCIGPFVERLRGLGFVPRSKAAPVTLCTRR